MTRPAAIALCLLALAGCDRHGDEAGTIVLHGNVDIRQVSLAFEEAGRITMLGAEEGDRVKAGTVLARLDTTTWQLQAQQAEAQLAAQKQALLKLRNGSRPEEVTEAAARAEQARADAARAAGDLARLKTIGAHTGGQAISAEDLDHATRAAATAEAKVRELDAALRLARIGPRAEDIANAQAQVDAAAAQVTLLHHDIDLGELRAPADAVVRSRLLEPGDMASAQRPVLALALTHPKWVRVYLNEADLGRVHMGVHAQVASDSAPGQAIAGTVGYMSSVAEFTPKSVETEDLRTNLVYEVRVLVDDPGDRLRLGQPVTVRLRP
jgi:HlyD family secretion protein